MSDAVDISYAMTVYFDYCGSDEDCLVILRSFTANLYIGDVGFLARDERGYYITGVCHSRKGTTIPEARYETKHDAAMALHAIWKG